jgi:Ala-tRNA(Pro) deacylase
VYERLGEFLAAKHARYEVVTHSGAVTAQEQAAASRTSGRVFAKVVIVKERDGFVMAVVPASSVLDLNRLKGMIGHGELRLATVEEIRGAVPDCAPGAIPPFAALFGLRGFVDRSLLNAPAVTMPAGDLGTAVRMRSAEFRRLLEGRVGDFAVHETVMPPLRTTARGRPTRRKPPRVGGG